MSSNSPNKICVVTLSIEYDPKFTNPADWDWNDLVNQPIKDMSRSAQLKYFCETTLIKTENFDAT